VVRRNFIFRVARLLWPELTSMNEQRQVVGVGNVFFFLYTLPLALIGGVWLYRITDWARLAANWQGLLLMAALLLLFGRLNFYTIVEIHPGTFANSDSSLSGVILWSGLLVFGPDVLWLPLGGKLFELVWQLWRATTTASRWVYLRIFTLYVAAVILSSLVAVRLYLNVGGQIPIRGLLYEDVIVAVAAVALHVTLFALVYAGFVLYIVWAQGIITAVQSRRRIAVFFFLALGFPFLAYPFGVLAAGIYVQNNVFSYLFFVTGIALVSLLSRQLSRVAESSRQQSRQLLQLEALSREIIAGPPGNADLPGHLSEHVPSMFPSARVIIWAAPDEFLLRHPSEWYPAVDRFWDWLQDGPETRVFEADIDLPWREVQAAHNPIIAAPVLAVETQLLIGFIYIELQALVQPWDERSLSRLVPGVNSLAAQIASALRQAEVYEEALDFQRAVQELDFASEIQASFFPDKIPVLPGWELAVTIIPARQMAGDFFDFIPLDDHHLGILIADVTDKGVGPALYMALSRTLIRTYATEFQFEPDTVFFAANRRILKDARARLFVTVFFGVLNTETGQFTYSNAGHSAPYLLRADGVTVEPLRVTGMPIGIEDEAVWEQRSVQLEPGDVLLLYTDGIPDAINEEGEFFEVETFIDVAQVNATAPAHEIQAAIIEQLQRFVGEAPQVDDITLMVLRREK
jgi:serine phosphatase RsbU (regulator of sigma subunit)